MKSRWIHIIGLLILGIGCCSCTNTLSSSTDQGPTPIYPSELNIENSKTPTPQDQRYVYQMDEIDCDRYIQAAWGNGPGEFGFDVNDNRGPYPLRVDEEGTIYASDYVNNRILIYSTDIPTLSEIDLPDQYRLDMGPDTINWSNIDVSKGKIYLRFTKKLDGRYIESLAILSTNGEVLKTIDLDAYYPYRSLLLNSTRADKNEGAYLFFEEFGAIHYDAGYRPTLYVLSPDWEYSDMIVGWDKKFYIYDYLTDKLSDRGTADRIRTGEFITTISGIRSHILWDQIGITEVVWGGILGVDERGNIYLEFWDAGDSHHAIIRISRSGEQTKIVGASLSDNNISRIGSIALGRDGNFFVFSYDTTDLSKKPLILKCQFASPSGN